MTPAVNEVRAGFVVSVEQEEKREGEPTVFNARQIPSVNSLPIAPPVNTQSTKEIEFSVGPVKIIGYIDISNLQVGVRVEVFGAHILNLYGNLKDGVCGNFDLFLAKGQLCLHLKKGNEVWFRFDIKVSFDGSFKDDVQLLKF
ncbi:hypothetical protein BDV10DRAFT_179638 [Aspergillus recurvatus]